MDYLADTVALVRHLRGGRKRCCYPSVAPRTNYLAIGWRWNLKNYRSCGLRAISETAIAK